MISKRASISRAVVLLLVLVIVLPISYVILIEALVSHHQVGFSPGFEDYSFSTWNLSMNRLHGATISIQNGVLSVLATGNLSAGVTLLAQRYVNVTFDLNRFRYLIVQVRASSVYAAAKVVIWTDSVTNTTVLLKTYDDNLWHVEVVDLSQFKITSNRLYEVELGWQLLDRLPAANASFAQLSLNMLT